MAGIRDAMPLPMSRKTAPIADPASHSGAALFEAEALPELDEALARLPQRSQQLLKIAQQAWDRQQGLCLFAYGSLIWKPGFEPAQTLPAQVHGYHRALRLRSLVNRGSQERPGLVLTLLSGGSCHGLVYRAKPAESETLLNVLWAREMVVGSYEPRWLNCKTPHGPVRALGFTLSRASPGYVGELSDAALLDIFKHSHGRYGSTLDYLMRTVQSLRDRGLRDADLERQWRLAARHGLCPALN
ncbi:gamma-glutamylcyclotransferase [Paucibacter sp. Y2R2-4]|uniref:gamma-glutamylcyclotransferase n=1 Tax=Paucibacter sp. Y2R2-4 TaxID=2893553 RepID=UPI0021E3E51E|nr:gamma-glutamylcyclotransferase [Paucibacter sp. Y2R2-4]MCV2348463.1 gamma-glutamylcyclotransferase [Paucibacter sp. Y2R2-4]